MAQLDLRFILAFGVLANEKIGPFNARKVDRRIVKGNNIQLKESRRVKIPLPIPLSIHH